MSPKQPKQTVSESKQVANGLQGNEDYYADLELWLQITGFHDPAIRESKLKTYKIRKNLEERKRALEEEFAELERREAAEAQELRAPKQSDSVHGYRIRGVGDRSPSPTRSERRGSMSMSGGRRSFDEGMSRDDRRHLSPRARRDTNGHGDYYDAPRNKRFGYSSVNGRGRNIAPPSYHGREVTGNRGGAGRVDLDQGGQSLSSRIDHSSLRRPWERNAAAPDNTFTLRCRYWPECRLGDKCTFLHE
ncbi:hypothetical protein H2203_001450 [Taxawa tesnikishii (nom. ined.)]|nr:hypothetical protein H2203_001450 [Dothideales sp. JES 119]